MVLPPSPQGLFSADLLDLKASKITTKNTFLIILKSRARNLMKVGANVF